MLRNIPNKYTRDMILDEIDSFNFRKKYDFFYLPIDFRVSLSLYSESMQCWICFHQFHPHQVHPRVLLGVPFKKMAEIQL